MQAPPSQLISLGKAFLIIFGEKIDERHVWNDFKVLLGRKAAFIETVSSGPEECPSKALSNTFEAIEQALGKPLTGC